ncbi:MAG: hypothetical protein WEE64_05375 [Dehalococcoidia bacterium]
MTDITTRDGYYYGPLRAPANEGRGTHGNIHSDEDAQRLGFRGGLVAGSIHMEQFAPLLVRAFGERWLERGALSLYFLTPTLHGEEVRAVIGVPPEGADNAQVEAWAERPDGTRICEGTASIGEPAEPSALRARDLERFPSGELRILVGATAGDDFPVVETSVELDAVERRREVITEPMPWYSDASRWGGIVPTTVNQVNALIEPAYAYLAERRDGAIGLYGAIELRNVNGPLLAETAYRAGGTLLAAGQSLKTEYLWFDTWADEPTTGRRVVEMRMLLRFMKASSRLYAETAATARETP